jgi:hypothetical protein
MALVTKNEPPKLGLRLLAAPEICLVEVNY